MDGSRELIRSGFQAEDTEIEYSLRPKTLREYIGQQALKQSMDIYIQAAKKRAEPLDHVLLYGPPGLGKTAFAGVIANEMGVSFRVTSGPAILHGGDLAAILTNLNAGDVLFIDEIHRLNTAVEEVLYSAMEDFVLDIMMGKGPGARSIRMDLPRFTLVGATTKAGMLSSPLRDRFGMLYRLELYEIEELKAIILRSAGILGAQIDEAGAHEIAGRARGTPRVANRLLKRARDYADVRGDGRIGRESAKEGLDMLGIDYLGLDASDRRVLTAIIEKYGGGPVGLDTIAATTGEEAGAVEDIFEPYMLRLGFIARTPRGRLVMPAAYRHLGLRPPAPANGQLCFEDAQTDT